mgnify:CR=1 FL=1
MTWAAQIKHLKKWAPGPVLVGTQFLQRWPGANMFLKAHYVNMKAVLLALDEVNGDLSNGQAALKNALSNMAFDTPTGPVSLDENRQAILSNYVSEIVRLDGGGIGPKVLLSIADVT